MPMTCRSCGASFALTAEEKAGYETFGFDPIPECFTCMQMHKLSFRNGRTLYKRTCDATGKSVISMYAPDAPFVVYDREYWHSDAWDPLSFGRPFDASRPFFDQLRELHHAVPRVALFNINPENSDYCNMCSGNKDSYCVFGGDFNDTVLYGILCMHNRSCVDCDYSNHNELCHDACNAFHCYGCRSVVDSKNCTDCAYISDCIGCQDCILCVNLVKKRFCIGNEQLSEEEYKSRKEQLLSGSWSVHAENLTRLRNMRARRIVKYTHQISCEQCTGDFMENSKGCTQCFFCTDSHDATDAFFVTHGKDTFLASFVGHASELCYQSMACIECHGCRFCFAAGSTQEAEYCETIFNCANIFGCVGLRHKRHCILNVQYSPEEYTALRKRIIEHMRRTGEWGEFLPKDMSCFAYNESTAQEFFPLGKEEALTNGFRWRDQTDQPVQAERIIPAASLPDSIADTPEDIVQWAVQCEKTGRAFRITKQEFDFYRTNGIPIPRLHPDERYTDRLRSYINPPVLYERPCMQCGKPLQTTYAPDRMEKVDCEECYLKAVY